MIASALLATALMLMLAGILAAVAGWCWLIAAGHGILAALIVVALMWLWMFAKFQKEAHWRSRNGR